MLYTEFLLSVPPLWRPSRARVNSSLPTLVRYLWRGCDHGRRFCLLLAGLSYPRLFVRIPRLETKVQLPGYLATHPQRGEKLSLSFSLSLCNKVLSYLILSLSCFLIRPIRPSLSSHWMLSLNLPTLFSGN